MQNTLELLSLTERQRLTELADEIVKAVFPEKIICYGYRRLSVQRWQVFSGSQMLKDEIAFDILVIKGKTNPLKDEDVLTLLDKIKLPYVSANYIVARTPGVNTAITEGSHFFNLVSKYGWLVVDSGMPLKSFEYDCSLCRCIDLAKGNWTIVHPRAFGFYKGAEYYRSVGNWEQEVFSLHQAVEQMALALVRAVTGYRPPSHNLSRLIALMELAGLDCSPFFPVDTPQEEELFSILKKAYSYARYDDEFSVPMEAALVLYERVGLLLKAAEGVYDNQINKWKLAAEAENAVPLSVAYVNTLMPAS